MKDWSQIDTHVCLWLLVAFALGTLWQPALELVAPAFVVDNQETMEGR